MIERADMVVGEVEVEVEAEGACTNPVWERIRCTSEWVERAEIQSMRRSYCSVRQLGCSACFVTRLSAPA